MARTEEVLDASEYIEDDEAVLWFESESDARGGITRWPRRGKQMNGQELIRRYKAGERDFSGVNLSGANLLQAYLSGASLHRTNLGRANLMGAKLSKAKLREADLTGADLHKANLCEAIVTEGQLAQAKSLAGATLPDGTKHE